MVTLFLCGDVMTGRGVDQILPHPGNPRLWESWIKDARAYVELAEAVNGPIPRPVDFAWPWGDALAVLRETAPDARVINLETAVTRSDDAAQDKAVCYRMNPANIACLSAATPDVCALANNHVLDFGYQGMVETLNVLKSAGISTTGAGDSLDQARRPAVVKAGDGTRILVFSCAATTSGVPNSWAATADRAGVNLVPPAPSAKRPGEIVVVSIHWGSNWGYHVSSEQVELAHALIDGGADLVHGHSSHHPRPIEIYRERLILYGCGDFIDDYEGIAGHEEYRDDLRLMYFAGLETDGRLRELRMVPLQARQMRLHRATSGDTQWLRSNLHEISRPFGVRVTASGSSYLAAIASTSSFHLGSSN